MIHQATQKIADMLTEKNFKYDILEDENGSRVICGINGKCITYRVQFVSTDEDNDVAVRAFDLVKFPEEKQTDMIIFANECNMKYRYLKFDVNCKDNTFQAEYDLPVRSQNPGEIAFEILVRMMRILDDIGADMMRRVWA